MKIAVVNTSDTIGGAAVACKRLVNALKESGTDVKMVVQEKKSTEPNVVSLNENFLKNQLAFFRFALEYFYFLKFENAAKINSTFSPARLGQDISNNKIILEADLINLHWINNSFLSLRNIKNIFSLNKPVIWFLHDMWAFTGGCHYSGNCNNFMNKCGNCYFLKKTSENDLSRKIWEHKNTIYKDASLTIVCPSMWLSNLAMQSSLLKYFNVYTIPNPIDTTIFKPIDKDEAKRKLGLETGKKYLLFAAMNTKHKRKGFDYLKESVLLFKKENTHVENVELLIVGKFDEQQKSEFDFKVNSLGVINGENKMVDVYNASDVYLIPSLEDNLPNTVMEAMACGTPVVGFNTGGIPEMVDHLQNGYIAEYGSSQDFTKGISWVLSHNNFNALCLNARKKVLNNYTFQIIAKQHIELYNKLLSIKAS